MKNNEATRIVMDGDGAEIVVEALDFGRYAVSERLAGDVRRASFHNNARSALAEARRLAVVGMGEIEHARRLMGEPVG